MVAVVVLVLFFGLDVVALFRLFALTGAAVKIVRLCRVSCLC